MLKPMLDHHLGRIMLQPIQSFGTILVCVVAISVIAPWVLNFQSCILVCEELLTVLVGPRFHKRTDGRASSTCRCPKLVRNICESGLVGTPPEGVRMLSHDLDVCDEQSI